MLLMMAEDAVIDLTGSYQEQLKEEAFLAGLGKSLLHSLELETCDKVKTVLKSGHVLYVHVNGGNSRWKIDLLDGSVFGPSGQVTAGDPHHSWEKQDDFHRVFSRGGKLPGFRYRSLGEGVYSFEHPQMGIVRLISYPIRIFFSIITMYKIQRQFPGHPDVWFQLEAHPPHFPEILSFDHTFWVPIEDDLHIGGFYTTLKEGRLRYVLKSSGEIVEVDPETARYKEKGLTLDSPPEIQQLESLNQFDSHRHLLCFSRQGKLEKLLFPRYVSQEGNPLHFRWQAGLPVWTENTRYTLAKQMPKGCLGSIPNYLCLESLDKKEPKILLVPFQPIQSQGQPIPEGSLKVENNTPLLPIDEAQLPKEQWGVFHYFVYSFERGKVKETTLEGRLFLAYLSFSQKQYAKAVRLLRSIKPTESLSPLGMKVIDLILDFPFGEDHPDARMVHLQALWVKMKQKERSSKEKITSYFDKAESLWKSMQAVQSMQNSLNNISAGCRLEPEEEKQLVSSLIEEGKQKRSRLPSEEFESCMEALERHWTCLKNPGGVIQKNEQVRAFRKWPEMSYSSCVWFEKPSRKYDLKACELYFGWMKTRELPFLLTSQASSSMVYKKNGYFLREVLTLAKGGSVDERRACLYCLLRLKGQKPRKEWIDLLITILVCPEKFPAPIDLNSGWEQIIKFLEVLELKYLCHSPSHEAVMQFLLLPPSQRKLAPLPAGNYPIPHVELSKEKESAEKIAPEPLPLPLACHENPDRWETLARWKESWLRELPKETSAEAPEWDFQLNPSLIKPGEEAFIPSLIKDFQMLEADYSEGKKLNESEKKWVLSEASRRKLLEEAVCKHREINNQIECKMKALLQEVNQTSGDPLVQQKEQAQIGGLCAQPLDFSDCVDMLLSFDKREYRVRNPHLSMDKIEEIAQLTIEIEELKSFKAQLSLLEKLCRQFHLDADRNDLSKQVAACLSARYDFEGLDSQTQMVLQIFSGETGMIPYEKQIRLIRAMLTLDAKDPSRFADSVSQLIMGGGKTSVIATIILYLTAKKRGRLSLFIVPAPLFQTVTANISDSVLKAFHKHVQSVDMVRDDMTQFSLERVLATLHRAKQRGEPVIMKASTVQAFELEFLSQARRLKALFADIKETEKKKQEMEENSSSWTMAATEKEFFQNSLKQLNEVLSKRSKELETMRIKLKTLSKLCTEFSASAEALLDEVDLVLSCCDEVNFPDGETQLISTSSNELLHSVFKLMLSKELKVPTLSGSPLVADIVQLEDNNQTLMPAQLFSEHVVPVLARGVAKSIKSIRDQLCGYEESFIRYASGRMLPVLQACADCPPNQDWKVIVKKCIPNWQESAQQIESDVAFLRYLKSLHGSEMENQTEAASLMALTRHLLCELLPSTLTKSGRRHYGPSPSAGSSKIIPYLAVNTPATTQFGYYLEEACYHYQWAAAFPTEPVDVLHFARLADASARYYVERNGEKYEETVEYKEFFRFFGMNLDDIEDPAKLKQAAANLSGDLHKRLDLRFETVAREVAYRSERLSSNGMNLISQLRSARTMSGTPWNVEGYHKKLFDRFQPDVGTEGQIIHTMAKRASQTPVHAVDFSTLEEFLDPIFSRHPKPSHIRGIIETGGLFKVFPDNASVAKAIMEYLATRQEKGSYDLHVNGVLFFHNDPGQSQPDTLYVWKKGAAYPERIGGTSAKLLESKGLLPSNYFVYYPERQTTGIDIAQTPGAINLLTFDEKMIRRAMTQGGFRLRQYLSSQNFECVVTKAARKLLLNQGKTIDDFIYSAEKNQSVQKTKDMVRYFQQQIDNPLRAFAVQDLCQSVELPLDAFVKKMGDYEPFYVTRLGQDFYQLHGRLKQKRATKDMLVESLKLKSEALRKVALPPAEMDQEEESLARHIQNADCLSEQWVELGHSCMGVTQEVEVQTQIQAQQETEIQTAIEQSIDLELQRYEEIEPSPVENEKKMTEADFLQLIDAVRHGDSSFAFGPAILLKEQLKKYPYGFMGEPKPYQTIFQEPVFGTRAFFYPCGEAKTLPIFHPMQRPPNQILAIQKENSMRWLLLSEYEANAARNHLLRLYSKNRPSVDHVWLIQTDGTFLVQNPQAHFPFSEESVERGMLELNALAGNARFLDQHQDDFEMWLQEDADLKVRFLKLRTARDEKKNQVLRSIPLIQGKDKDQAHSFNYPIFHLRAEQEKSRRGSYKPPTLSEVKKCPLKKVKDLDPECLPHLGIDWSAPDSATQEAIKDLQLKSQNEAEEWTRKQFAQLVPAQIPFLKPQQIHWLPQSKVQFLEHPHQICTIENGWRRHLLSYFQMQGLVEQQAHLIPSIDPDFYQFFRQPWQIQAVPAEFIGKLMPWQWQYLKKQQWKELPLQLLWSLQNLQNLPPEVWGCLHGDAIRMIPRAFLDRVCREQIQEITDLALIKELEQIASIHSGLTPLEAGTWSSWVSPQKVPYLNEDQIQYLKEPEQIQQVPLHLVPLLKIESQIPHISSLQVPGLKGAGQIQACPYPLVPCLEAIQVVEISSLQVPYLRGERQIQALQDPGLIAALQSQDTPSSVNQIQWMSDAQLPLIEKKHVQGLTLRQIQSFIQSYKEKWDQIREGLTQRQAESFNSTQLITSLSDDQICAWLTENQVPFLIEEWVKKCPRRLVPALKRDQINWISDKQVPDLEGEEQVHAIKDALIEYLRPKQMCWINDHQLGQITLAQVPGLNPQQLLKLKESKDGNWAPYQKAITKEQIQTFDTEKLMGLLNAEQIHTHLVQKQVALLKEPWQIQACPDALVSFLNEKQIPHAGEKQIPFLDIKTQGAALQDVQLGFLSGHQVKSLQQAAYGKPIQRATRNAFFCIVILADVGLLVAGSFALVGGHARFAPQFMVVMYQGMGSIPNVYLLTGGSGILFVNLIAFAIHQNSKKRKGYANLVHRYKGLVKE